MFYAKYTLVLKSYVAEFYKILKEQKIPVLYNLFQKNKGICFIVGLVKLQLDESKPNHYPSIYTFIINK